MDLQVFRKTLRDDFDDRTGEFREEWVWVAVAVAVAEVVGVVELTDSAVPSRRETVVNISYPHGGGGGVRNRQAEVTASKLMKEGVVGT